MLTEFSADDEALLKVYHSIADKIDWQRDTIYLMGSSSLHPLPQVVRYLKEERKVTEGQLEPCPVNRYYIDVPTALQIEIE